MAISEQILEHVEEAEAPEEVEEGQARQPEFLTPKRSSGVLEAEELKCRFAGREEEEELRALLASLKTDAPGVEEGLCQVAQEALGHCYEERLKLGEGVTLGLIGWMAMMQREELQEVPDLWPEGVLQAIRCAEVDLYAVTQEVQAEVSALYVMGDLEALVPQ